MYAMKEGAEGKEENAIQVKSRCSRARLDARKRAVPLGWCGVTVTVSCHVRPLRIYLFFLTVHHNCIYKYLS